MDSSSRLYILAAVGVAAVAILMLFAPTIGSMAVAGVAGAALLVWAVSCTTRNSEWLLVVLILLEALAASTLFGNVEQSAAAWLRYPITVLFCLPIVPAVWRSGILREGGFRNYAIYLLWAAVTATYSSLPVISFGRLFSTALAFCALCAVTATVKDADGVTRLCGILLATCAFLVTVNWIVMLLFPGAIYWLEDPQTGMYRFGGVFNQPNEIGTLMLTTVAAAVGYWPAARGWKKAGAVYAVIGALALAAIADSRSSFVAVGAGLAAYLAWRYRARGVAVIGATALMLLATTLAVPRVRAYFDRGDVSSFTGRDVAWDFAIRSIEQRPVLGYGYETDGQIFQSPYFPDWSEIWNEGPRSSIHDGYLSRAAGLGIPALLFWLFFTIRPVTECFRRDRDPWQTTRLALLAVVPALILNITEVVPDCRYIDGVLLGLMWMILERERLFVQAYAVRQARIADESKPVLVRAFQAAK